MSAVWKYGLKYEYIDIEYMNILLLSNKISKDPLAVPSMEYLPWGFWILTRQRHFSKVVYVRKIGTNWFSRHLPLILRPLGIEICSYSIDIFSYRGEHTSVQWKRSILSAKSCSAIGTGWKSAVIAAVNCQFTKCTYYPTIVLCNVIVINDIVVCTSSTLLWMPMITQHNVLRVSWR